jgi:hypothetical protein
MRPSEAITEVVHANVSIAKFKELIRIMKEVRYVIDGKGRIHVGSARNFIHSGIKMEAFEDFETERQELLIHGYATVNENEKRLLHYISYISHHKESVWVSDCGEDERQRMFKMAHPKIEELASRGVIHSPSPFHFVA